MDTIVKKISKKTERIFQDRLEEKVLGKKLDYIYNQIGFSFERTADKNNQIKGSDLKFLYKNKEYVADEKNAARYYFKDLKTFSFELSFINRKGELMDGWLVSDKSITDLYIINYIRAPENNNNFQTKLSSIESLFIGKRKINKYIKSLGYESPKDLIQVFNNAHKQGKTKVHNGIESYFDLPEGIHLFKTIRFEECPLNIIISKDILIRLTCHHSIASYPMSDATSKPKIKIFKTCFTKNEAKLLTS